MPTIPDAPAIPITPAKPLPVFFPPVPPPLERITKPTGSIMRLSYPASETLSAYVNEPFYPALAARLEQMEMTRRKQSNLDKYREDKRTVLAELRTELAYILQQPAAARPPLLAKLAQKQDPKILALEARAEDLRRSLTDGDYEWGALRDWKLGNTKTASETPGEVQKVMLSAAFFQNGLSLQQRGLLREIAIEISQGGKTAEDAMEAQPYIFFFPSPARVRFPEKVPEAVAAKIARYDTRKSALRKELYDTIYREDSAWFETTRSAALRSLAERQAPEFAILEELAEEIRRDLAPMPPLPRMAPLVPLPPVLSQKLTAIFRRHTTEQLRIKDEIGKIQERYPKLRLSGYFLQGRFFYTVKNVGSSSFNSYRDTEKIRNEATEELVKLSKRYDLVIAGLVEESTAIKRELAETMKTKDTSELSLATAEAARRAIEQETDDSIDEYFVAVFEPGLSPPQRRLLFDGAMESLEMPLPGGEMQPTRRMGMGMR